MAYFISLTKGEGRSVLRNLKGDRPDPNPLNKRSQNLKMTVEKIRPMMDSGEKN